VATSEIRLEGASNFRDIGGHATTDGRRIKRNQLFRSGELSRLTDTDFMTLRDLDIALVVDLRSKTEAERQRTRWPTELVAKHHNADISTDLRVNGRKLPELLKEDPTPEGAARVMEHTFRVLPDMCGPALKQVADRLANNALPAVFHCTNGRDRTGIISAMLLYMLGATQDAIVKDFVTTNERMNIPVVIENTRNYLIHELGHELDDATIELCVRVQPQNILAAFDEVTKKHGSPEGYFQHWGVEAGTAEKMKLHLLAPL
jgi:protein-tyrosine phosphatase